MKAKRSGSKGAESRHKIVVKAAPLFNKKGFEGCSMQDIVAAAGLEKGAIYNHFASKEQIAVEAFDYCWGETVQKRMHGMDSIDNRIDRLKHYVHTFVQTPSFSGGCPLLNTTLDADDGNSALRIRARAALADWENAIVRMIEEGQERDEIAKTVVPIETAQMIICLLEGASALGRLNKNSGHLLAAGKQLEAFLEQQRTVTLA